MTGPDCPGTCQSAAVHAALAQLTRLTAETAQIVTDLRSKTQDLHQRLNAHSQLIEQHHRMLNPRAPQETTP